MPTDTYYQGANHRIQALVPEAATHILDVGCGTGNLGAALKAGRPDRVVWGMDGHEPSVNEARTKLDRVILGNLDRMSVLPVPERYFDCVTLGDILEHLAEPARFLLKLRRNLSPNGQIICSIPNVSHWSIVCELLAGQFRYQDAGLLDRTHLRFFTPATVRSLLFEAGYRITHEEEHRLEDPVMEVLVQAAGTAGMDMDRSRSALGCYQQLVCGNLMPAIFDERTAGQLGQASSAGTSVVIVTYNSAATIEQCLSSVLASLGPRDEVIIVDNQSGDPTVEIAKRTAAADPRVILVENASNLGFSMGVNVGLKSSKGEFLVLLNPDTIVWKGWLSALTAALTDGVGMVGPLSDNVSGAQFVGLHLPPNQEWVRGPDDLANWAISSHLPPVETKLLIGLCVLLRRDTLDRVGLLDEDLFLGSDDLELSWRIRSHGLSLLVVRNVFVHHIGGVSFGSQPKERTKELLFQSTEALLAKMRVWCGWQPSSTECWGIDIVHAD